MAHFAFTEFRGVALNGTTQYQVTRLAGSGQYAANTILTERMGLAPRYRGQSRTEARFEFQVIRPGDVDAEAWVPDVLQLFNPYEPPATIRGTFNGESIENQAMVANVEVRGGTHGEMWGKRITGEMILTDAVWRSTVDNGPETTSPVEAGGNLPASPVITLTNGGTAVTRHRYNIRARNQGGVSGYPVRIQVVATAVFINGLPVPFTVEGSHTWFRVHLPPGVTVPVDIFTGGSADAGLDAMDSGSMDLANSTNTAWQYSGWIVSANPGGGAGMWLPGITDAKRRAGRTYTWGLTAENSGYAEIHLAETKVQERQFEFANDVDSLVLTSGVPMTTITGLERLTYTYRIRTPYTGNNIVVDTFMGRGPRTVRTEASYVTRKRLYNQDGWTTAHSHINSSTGSTTEYMTGVIDVSDAVSIAVGLRTPPNKSAAGYLRIAGEPVVGLQSEYVPEITFVGSESARLIESGALINSTTGAQIGFTRLYYDDAGIEVDTLNRTIQEVSGAYYGSFSGNDIKLMTLAPGNNTWSVTGDLSTAGIAWSWRNRWAF